MASQPPSSAMPIFYNSLEPLSSSQHGKHKMKGADHAPYLVNSHAVPITVDEFVFVQRNFPIVFSIGDNAVPLALMGLNEGVNVYVDQDGRFTGEVYVPAYIRRYPFMLARLTPQAQEMSLCFDPTSGLVGEFDEGVPLFEEGEGKPSEATNSILQFCEEFELSAQRTVGFMKELTEMDLLMEGEVTIQPTGVEQPFIYRGFQMVNEEKFRDLTGDKLRKMNQNGMLPLILAHLFSMSQMRDLFAKQIAQGKGPQIPAAGTPVFGNA